MEVLGVGLPLLATFVGFGLLIGVLFGFFGMGGSFLVTPALLILGYDTSAAVGSGMAFVFGTSVIATLKHRDLGQIDYKLGVLMIVGTATGIEVGKEAVLFLEELGMADTVVSVAYVGLLGAIGLFITREALAGGGGGGLDHDATGDVEDADIPAVARAIQSYRIPPMIGLQGGFSASLWMILAVAFATGLLSGFLGVGGGFIRMPALFYLVGVPVPVAVGTDLFEIMFSGGIGTFLWAQSGGVDLSIVVPLLAGSALGARVGAAATSLVDEDEIKIYFGLMLLGGAVAVAARKVGEAMGSDLLHTLSLVLIMGAALVVGGAIVLSAVRNLRAESAPATAAAD